MLHSKKSHQKILSYMGIINHLTLLTYHSKVLFDTDLISPVYNSFNPILLRLMVKMQTYEQTSYCYKQYNSVNMKNQFGSTYKFSSKI